MIPQPDPLAPAPAAVPLPSRLVLIRHAHTASNDEGDSARLCGWADLPLTRRGRTQVELLRSRFRNPARFAAVYSSSLRRARETAAALGACPVPVQLDPDLREIGCGLVDGMKLRQIRKAFPDLWAANLRQDDAGFRWPGGESYREFRTRCLRAFDRIAGQHPGQTVGVVTHAGVITQIVGTIAGTHPARWEQHRPGNTGVSEVIWSNGSGVLVRFNDRVHLVRPVSHPSPLSAALQPL